MVDISDNFSLTAFTLGALSISLPSKLSTTSVPILFKVSSSIHNWTDGFVGSTFPIEIISSVFESFNLTFPLAVPA